MDRIFFNVETGQTLISYKRGVMPISSNWLQIGTIDVRKLIKGGFIAPRKFRGRIKVS